MKGCIQINVIYANKLYRRPANQYESDSSVTYTAHDTNLMLLVFLDLNCMESFIHNIWSNETVDPYLKKFTFKCIKLILVGQVFHVYLQLNAL